MSHPGVICGTCGRDNAPNLVFCQDCGARLGPRVAPPTPAIIPSYDSIPQEPAASAPERKTSQKPPSDVLLTPSPTRALDSGLADVDALLGGPGSERPSELEPAKETRSRPSAPNFDFSPREKNEKPPSLGAEEPPTRSQCSRCGASNATHIRYCLKCGNQLRSSMGPSGPASVRPMMTEAAAANPPPPSTRNPQEPRAAEQPIAPLPVLGVGQIPPSASTVRICTRCRGVCDSKAQFCKFCGASLVDASLTSRPLSAPPPIVDARVDRQNVDASFDPPTPAAAFDVPVAPRLPNVARPPTAIEAPSLSKPEPPRPGAKAQLGRLIVIAKDGGEGQSWPIGERLDVGRTEGDVLVPDDGYLSPRHARLSWRNGRLFLRDLGTTNGVYLRLAARDAKSDEQNADKSVENAKNGVSHERERGSIALRLEDQDLILIGQQVIRFEVVKDAEEGLGPASQHGTLVFGTPVAPRYARLCLRTVEGVTRDVYYLGKRETILGRESGDIIFAEDPFLSRRHAAIHVQEGENKKRSFSLFDFGSSNGTFVQIRGEAPLQSGDEFRVGQQLFRVELTA